MTEFNRRLIARSHWKYCLSIPRIQIRRASSHRLAIQDSQDSYVLSCSMQDPSIEIQKPILRRYILFYYMILSMQDSIRKA